jgi:hypothetical protein
MVERAVHASWQLDRADRAEVAAMVEAADEQALQQARDVLELGATLFRAPARVRDGDPESVRGGDESILSWPFDPEGTEAVPGSPSSARGPRRPQRDERSQPRGRTGDHRGRISTRRAGHHRDGPGAYAASPDGSPDPPAGPSSPGNGDARGVSRDWVTARHRRTSSLCHKGHFRAHEWGRSEQTMSR